MGSGQKDTRSEERPVVELVERIHEILGVRLDAGALRHALTHRSYAYEHGGIPNNERLEFLGDSVLGLVVTESLYADHPDLAEGQLAKLRAACVNMRALAAVGRTLGLGEFLLLGRGEEATGGRDKASILADTVEALIGTVYLAEGIETSRAFVHHLVDPLMRASTRLGAGLDWKTSLQELAAAGAYGAPEYRVSEDGPDHEKVFTALAVLGTEVLGEGVGHSKKEAEQRAAEMAWTELDRRAEAATREVAAFAEPADVAAQDTPAGMTEGAASVAG